MASIGPNDMMTLLLGDIDEGTVENAPGLVGAGAFKGLMDGAA
jgi:hypothetical protein